MQPDSRSETEVHPKLLRGSRRIAGAYTELIYLHMSGTYRNLHRRAVPHAGCIIPKSIAEFLIAPLSENHLPCRVDRWLRRRCPNGAMKSSNELPRTVSCGADADMRQFLTVARLQIGSTYYGKSGNDCRKPRLLSSVFGLSDNNSTALCPKCDSIFGFDLRTDAGIAAAAVRNVYKPFN